VAEDLLPRVQRRLSSFLSEERGAIPRQSVLSIGGILAASTALASLAAATHQNEPLPENPKCRTCHSNNVSHVNQVIFGGGNTLQITHSNNEPFHCSHSNCQPAHYK
jgi:hypothetical protein